MKPVDDASPLYFRLLEINQEAYAQARRFQIIETLRGVFVGEALDTLQLNYQQALDGNVSDMFSRWAAFVDY